MILTVFWSPIHLPAPSYCLSLWDSKCPSTKVHVAPTSPVFGTMLIDPGNCSSSHILFLLLVVAVSGTRSISSEVASIVPSSRTTKRRSPPPLPLFLPAPLYLSFVSPLARDQNRSLLLNVLTGMWSHLSSPPAAAQRNEMYPAR